MRVIVLVSDIKDRDELNKIVESIKDIKEKLPGRWRIRIREEV